MNNLKNLLNLLKGKSKKNVKKIKMIDFIATVICGSFAVIIYNNYAFFKNRKILAWILSFYPMEMLRYFGAKYFNINQVIFGTNTADQIIRLHNFMLSVISFFVVFF